VIWHVIMSIDGFIAGPDHSMDWAFDAFKDAGPNRLGEEVMNTTGAILGGRGCYEAARAHYDGIDGIYGGRWAGPVFVLTHHPQDAPDDPKATFVSSGIEDALARAHDAAGERNVEIIGASVARECLDAGFIDEIVHLAPVLLGDGVRLYGTPPSREFDFESEVDNVRRAARDLRVEYSVVIDSDYAIWSAFENHYWPGRYFSARTGTLRGHRFGEGDYGRSEKTIPRLWAGISEAGDEQVSVDAVGVESDADWDNLRSPETYVGYERTANCASSGGFGGKRQRLCCPVPARVNEWALSGDGTDDRRAAVLNAPDGRMSGSTRLTYIWSWHRQQA
jgi:dihydrofolate reductase